MTKVSYIVNKKEFTSYTKAQEEGRKKGARVVTRYTYSDELDRSKVDESFRKKMQEYFAKKRKGVIK